MRRSKTSYELKMYPRHHLDEASALCRIGLPYQPIAMDCHSQYLLVALPPFNVRVYELQLQGQISPKDKARIQPVLVRELSLVSARQTPLSMQFVPPCYSGQKPAHFSQVASVDFHSNKRAG